MSLDINIKYFDTPEYTQKRLESIAKGDWIDLYAAKDTFVPYIHDDKTSVPLKPTLIPLGVAMELPEGYEAHLIVRSSTFKNWGIMQTNSMGVIDNSYCGDNDQWMLPAICVTPWLLNGGVTIHAGDKICQFRIIEKMPDVTFNEVDHLDGPDRGGFGSTGTA